MQPNPDNVRALIEADPAYEAGSAYERTKLACHALTKLGAPIPSWIVLRDLIGKGSATDISRGVKAYRAEHAELLQRMDGLPEGIPDALAEPMKGLWQAALTEATALFAQERQELLAARDTADATALEHQRERELANAALAQERARVESHAAIAQQERERANGERAAREQAERMAERHIADLTAQRDNLAQVVQANTKELQTLNLRLEDVRRRAQMEVEHARQQVEAARQQALREGEQKTAKLETQLRGENAGMTVEIARLQQRLADAAERNAKLTELVKKEAKGTSTAVRGRRVGPMPAGRARKLKGGSTGAR